MICYQMKKIDTEQVGIRLVKSTIKRLEDLAARFNRRAKAEIAAEVVEQYLDLWEAKETATREFLAQQKSAVLVPADNPTEDSYRKAVYRVQTDPKKVDKKRQA